MTLAAFNKYCLDKKGVEDTYPFKGEAVWMKVMGKMFAMANVQPLKFGAEMVEPFHFINLKCDPEYAVELRVQYAAIIPGWHQSKTHWNTLLMDGSLPDHLIRELIDHSYAVVVSGMSKKLQTELEKL